MLKSNELRIGNYVKYIIDTSEFVKITGINEERPFIDIKTWDVPDYMNIYPISLTEEWLLKFSFTQCSFIDFQFDSPHENDYRICIYDDKFIFRGLGASIVEIKTVHHLMNLYHSLTGQELTIK